MRITPSYNELLSTAKPDEKAVCRRLQRALRPTPGDTVTKPLLRSRNKRESLFQRLLVVLVSRVSVPNEMSFVMRLFLTASLALILAYLAG